MSMRDLHKLHCATKRRPVRRVTRFVIGAFMMTALAWSAAYAPCDAITDSEVGCTAYCLAIYDNEIADNLDLQDAELGANLRANVGE